MADNVEYLPIWKEGATAEEFLMELVHVARKHPERFEKLVVIRKSEANTIAVFSRGCTTLERLGLLVAGQFDTMRENASIIEDG